jgi:hypothetical protein
MALKSSFLQNYRTAILVHGSTFRCWDLSRRCGREGTWRRKWERLKAVEVMATCPQELAQDAVCQSHIGRLTELCFLPNRPKG